MKKFYIFLLTLVAVNGTVAQWFPQNSGTSKRLLSVCFPVEDTGYVVGHAESGSNGIILKTTDGGINWITQIENDSLAFHSVFFTDAYTGYVVGGLWNGIDNPGVVLKTTNGGESWSIVFTYALPLDLTELNDVYFPDTNTGYALGFGHCSTGSCCPFYIKTIDGGVNWTVDDSFSAEDPQSSLFFTSPDTGYVVGQDYDDGWILHKTMDGGANWSDTSMSMIMAVGWLSSVFFPDANTGYAVGTEIDSALILKTTDGGINWTKQLWYSNYYLNSVYFINLDIGFVVGTNGTILKTINGGINWSEQVSGTNKWLCAVKFTDSETGYIVGYNGTILKTTNGGGYPVAVNNQTPSSNLLKIYPNPSSNNITIETQGDGHLSMQNINGLELLNQTIFKPSTQIDVRYLPEGVYFMRLTNEKTVQVGKFIKE